MNALETVRDWLTTFPQSSVLTGFSVDYTDKIPSTGSILPDGLVTRSFLPSRKRTCLTAMPR